MEIAIKGNKILEKKAKKVAKIDDTIKNICFLMVKTMTENTGIGLAAPQVGISKRIIVVLIDNKDPKIFINPEISWCSSEQVILKEGCLSIPGEFLDKTRSRDIKVKYRDITGHPRYECYTGLNARVIQHEVDHLDGILMDQ
jgi:peptide deformylase